MARPRFRPTDEQRRFVETLSGYGVPEDEIAALMPPKGIDPKTLRKYFRHELDMGAIKAITKVAQVCYEMAISGRSPAAAFFWLKTYEVWREREREIEAQSLYHAPTEEERKGMSIAMFKALEGLHRRRREKKLRQERENNGAAASDSPADGEDEAKRAA